MTKTSDQDTSKFITTQILFCFVLMGELHILGNMKIKRLNIEWKIIAMKIQGF